MTREELLDELTVERYNGGGWKTPEPWARRPEVVAIQDDEVTIARRRRELLTEASEWHDDREETG